MFRISLIIMLLFGGILKLFNFKYTRKTILELKFFPKIIEKYIGVVLPCFEIIMSFTIGYLKNNLVYAPVLAYLLFFIGMNLTFMYEDKKCCCYGKILPSKLGKGGVIHYLYWVIIVALAIIYRGDEMTIPNLMVAVLLFVNSLLVRRVLEVTL